MLRDSVCDEATNNARCFFDGGDCCLEFKDETLCKNCSCILAVDPGELLHQLDQLQVKPLINYPSEYLDDANNGEWSILVDDVVSSPVCALLCLAHTEKAEQMNAWLYDRDSLTCRCTWLESRFCPDNFAQLDGSWTNSTNWRSELNKKTAFLQLRKVIPCRK